MQIVISVKNEALYNDEKRNLHAQLKAAKNSENDVVRKITEKVAK